MNDLNPNKRFKSTCFIEKNLPDWSRSLKLSSIDVYVSLYNEKYPGQMWNFSDVCLFESIVSIPNSIFILLDGTFDIYYLHNITRSWDLLNKSIGIDDCIIKEGSKGSPEIKLCISLYKKTIGFYCMPDNGFNSIASCCPRA